VDLKKERFIREIGPAALIVSAFYDVDPCILIAQAAVETDWGQCVFDHNYFNIPKHDVEKREFKTYRTTLEAFLDYVHMILKKPRFHLLPYLFHSPKDYFVTLQEAGFSKDSNYAAKCIIAYENIPDGWEKIAFHELYKKVEAIL